MHNIFYLPGIVFLVNISLAFMPYWTRKTENFGVSIPESMYFREDFNAMRKKYTTSLIVINLVFFVIFLGAAFRYSEATVGKLFTFLLIAFILISFLFYLPFHYQMKRIKQSENWHREQTKTIVVDIKFRQEKLTYSNGWFLIPTLITIATLAVTYYYYDLIPSKIPMHTDFSGNVTYDDKTLGNLLLLPGTQVFMLTLFIFINYIIKNTKQLVSVENPDKSKLQNITFRRRWSLYTLITSILLTMMLSYLQLTLIFPTLTPYQDIVIFTMVGIILLGTILLSVSTGQGGSRVKVSDCNQSGKVDRDDDRYWKLGQFYMNKNDPSIFVEKRFGIGWTNNWAHPLSWIVLIAILGLGVGIPILITLF